MMIYRIIILVTSLTPSVGRTVNQRPGLNPPSLTLCRFILGDSYDRAYSHITGVVRYPRLIVVFTRLVSRTRVKIGPKMRTGKRTQGICGGGIRGSNVEGGR